MVQVLNMRTGQTAVYPRSPHASVQLAHRQHTMRDRLLFIPRKLNVSETATTVRCGDWQALKQECKRFRSSVPATA